MDSPSPSRFPTARLVIGLLVALVLLIGIDVFLVLTHERHAYFGIDGWIGFYAILGLVAAGLLTLFATGLGRLLRRPPSVEDIPNPLPEDLDESLR